MDASRNRATNDSCPFFAAATGICGDLGMVRIVSRNPIALLLASMALAFGLCLQAEQAPASGPDLLILAQAAGTEAVPTQRSTAAGNQGQSKKYQWLLKERSASEAPQQESGTSEFF